MHVCDIYHSNLSTPSQMFTPETSLTMDVRVICSVSRYGWCEAVSLLLTKSVLQTCTLHVPFTFTQDMFLSVVDWDVIRHSAGRLVSA